MQALKGASWLGGVQPRTPFGEAGHFYGIRIYVNGAQPY